MVLIPKELIINVPAFFEKNKTQGMVLVYKTVWFEPYFKSK